MYYIFKYPLYQQFLIILFYIYHLIIIISFTGILNNYLEYINIFHSIITYITCLYIIYNFNMFNNKKNITFFDKDLIFMGGYLLLFTTTFSQSIFDKIQEFGFIGKQLYILNETKKI